MKLKKTLIVLKDISLIALSVVVIAGILPNSKQSMAKELSVSKDVVIRDETMEQGTEISSTYTEPSTSEQSAAIGSSFTYQAQLNENGDLANGIYDFKFSLYDGLNTGNQIGVTLFVEDLNVVNGLFMNALDFGPNAFNGSLRYLEISVRIGTSSNDADFVELSPRREITPAPYAMYAHTAGAARTVGSVSLLSAPDGRPSTALSVKNNGGVQVHTEIDVEDSNKDGSLLIGDPNSHNVAFDNNEIMARNNKQVSSLHIIGRPLVLRGLKIRYLEYSAVRDGTGGSSSKQMTPIRHVNEEFNSFCALTQVEMHDIDADDEYASCRILPDDATGNWVLQANLNKNQDHYVRCEAMCLIFNNNGRQ